MDQKTNFVFQCDFCFDLDLPPPSTRERPPGCKTVFVGGLPENATEEIIQEVFEQCGDITAIRKSKKNFCHIRFAEEFMVDKAIYLSGTSHSLMDFHCFLFVFCDANTCLFFLAFISVLLELSGCNMEWQGAILLFLSVYQDSCMVLCVTYLGAISCHPTTKQQILKFTTEKSYFQFTQVYIVLLTGCGKRRAPGQELCCFPVPIFLIGWQFHWHIFIDFWCSLNKDCLYACMYSATAWVRFWAPSVGYVCYLPWQWVPQKLQGVKFQKIFIFQQRKRQKKPPQNKTKN